MSDFDPAKDTINRAKHGISLARWAEMRVRAIVRDGRFDYGEDRFRAYGYIDGLAYCLVFTFRDGLRPISLRRAHDKEMRRHAP
ncbi:hypothetical protein BJ123_101102 [Rhodopseudomonas thermotolerans]|jgi:uncharacterized DUF497 family protein|uniref:BrnT family toxin n=2 Tax=Rhodopseudomonas TaxID=1073 RepID=A0A336JKG5_9BRAD|nr:MULTISPECIES: BrnT family toxin [Rhodopseudomonas]RED42385.1 hypothetical protein BJ125_101102 [Rhodopseudomonas pentothenatexigens]REG08175.1 hypothetical protein BJ123_101102 [Rhodopseudomonas thermotolerans]SSW88986.1 hypothetical protein SAMN05892882_101102 [Rhodopseudomonas pentothenatexigens]